MNDKGANIRKVRHVKQRRNTHTKYNTFKYSFCWHNSPDELRTKKLLWTKIMTNFILFRDVNAKRFKKDPCENS